MSQNCGNDAARREAPVPLMGRREELDRLVRALRRRQSRLVTGPPGAGKTRLIDEGLLCAGEPSVRVRQAGPLHELLVDLAVQLGCRLRRFPGPRRATSMSLKPAILETLEAAPRCVVVEDASEVEPRMYRFLREIYYLPRNCLVVTAASRQSLGYLRRLLWDPREEIPLRPLDHPEARRLFDEAARAFQLESLELVDFRRKVLAAAQGNPGQIVAMCRLAARPEYRNGRQVKFLPLRIDMFSSFIP